MRVAIHPQCLARYAKPLLPSWAAGTPVKAVPCEDRQVVPADFHDFFVASATVSGALIGLLFVAISVATERLKNAEAAGQLHRIGAYAAQVAFINTLVVSLFSLIPGDKIGPASLAVAIVGLVFVVAALLSLVRLQQVRWSRGRDAVFLVGLAVVFVFELLSGIDMNERPGDSSPVGTLAILVIVCFLIGIARAWDLIGGPSIGITREVVALVRAEQSARHRADTAADSPEAEDVPPA